MPHDDSYPAGYNGALVARLEAAPDSLFAFGHCESMSLDGERGKSWADPPISPDEDWSARSALRLLLGWNLGNAMRGIFRRAPVVEAGLWIRQTRGRAHADACWLFGMALLGRFEFVPEARCLKRFHRTSTHAQWQPLSPAELARVLTKYVLDYVPLRRERILAVSILWFGASVNRGASLVNKVTRATLVSPGARQRLFRRLLSPRDQSSS